MATHDDRRISIRLTIRTIEGRYGFFAHHFNNDEKGGDRADDNEGYDDDDDDIYQSQGGVDWSRRGRNQCGSV